MGVGYWFPEAIRDEMYEKVSKYLDALGKLDCAKDRLFCGVLSDAKVVLEAALPETKVALGSLVVAKTRLSTMDAAAKIWHGWFDSSCGTAILADADLLLAASALDDQCVEDYRLSKKAIEEDGMPTRSGPQSIEGDVDMVWNGQTTGLLGDACRHLVQALKAWSPIGSDEYMSGIIATIDKIIDAIMFVDVACLARTASTCGTMLAAWDAAFRNMPIDKALPLVSESIAASARDFDLDDQDAEVEYDCLKIMKEAAAGLDCLKGRSTDVDGVLGQLHDIMAAMKNNRSFRVHLRSETQYKAAIISECFDSLPGDFGKLVDEHKQSPKNSFLQSVILLAQHQQAPAASLGLRIWTTSCVMMSSPSEGAEPIPLDFHQMDACSILKVGSDSPCTQYLLDRFLKHNAKDAVAVFWQSVPFLHSFTMPSARVLSAMDTAEGFLKCILPAASWKEVSGMVDSLIEQGSLDGIRTALHRLPCAKVCSVTSDLLGLSGDIGIECQGVGILQGATSADKMMTIMGLYNEVAQAASLATWLYCKHLSPKVFVRTFKPDREQFASIVVNPSFEAGITFLNTLCTRLDSLLTQVSECMDSISGLQVGSSGLRGLLGALVGFLGKAIHTSMTTLSEKLDETASSCEALCPRWSHIIGQDEYKQQLVRKQLLKAPGRSTLPEMSNKLWTFSQSLRALPKTWAFVGDAAWGDSLPASLENAAAVNEMAALCLSVIAACNILEEFGNTQAGKAMAIDMLSTDRPVGFPKVLETKLQKLSRQ